MRIISTSWAVAALTSIHRHHAGSAEEAGVSAQPYDFCARKDCFSVSFLQNQHGVNPLNETSQRTQEWRAFVRPSGNCSL
jgi:hypothetical protein